MKNNSGIFVSLSFVVLVLIFTSIFSITEGRQAIITQFGKPIRVVQDAGLHFKIPFIHDVRMVDLRILNWDGYPNQIPTKDKKYIIIDTTARWKITDPLKFIQTVQNERVARKRLDAILDGITRDVISSHNLVEAVRNSNNILDTIEKKQLLKAEKKKSGESPGTLEEEIFGDIERITIGREKLSALIIKRARGELVELGIELIDVQIKRIFYEEGVQKKVFDRMISERMRIAEKIRSIGEGEKAKIEGKVELDLKKIESEAYKTIQKIKGKAEAQSTKIFARSLSQDPNFYKFTKKLELYEKTLNGNVKMILSTDSELWDVLKKGR